MTEYVQYVMIDPADWKTPGVERGNGVKSVGQIKTVSDTRQWRSHTAKQAS